MASAEKLIGLNEYDKICYYFGLIRIIAPDDRAHFEFLAFLSFLPGQRTE